METPLPPWECSRGNPLSSVVPPIEARIVCCPIDPDPVRLLNASAVPRRRTYGIGTRYLDPTVLLPGDRSDFLGDLGEILVLAKDEDKVRRGAYGSFHPEA